MDFEQPVFLPLPSFEKKAYANLSPNAADWVHDITKMVYDKIPYVTQFPTRIKLERVDEQKGYGYGSIKVGGDSSGTGASTGSTLDIPLIIKNFELQAIDIFLYQGKFYPLSERRIEEILFNPEVFGKPTDASGGDQSIYPSNYPPHSGKYTYASLLAVLNDKVTDEDKNRFVEKLGKDKSVFAAFKNSGTLGKVKQALTLTTKTKRDVNSILPPNVIQIEKLGEDSFLVRATSDQVYAPKEVTMTRAAVLRKFGAEAAAEALNKGVFTTIQGSRPYKPTLFENVEDGKASKITSAGKYEVRTMEGDRRLGWVYPNVVDFDLKKTGDKLFTDGEAYALQSDMVGLAIDSASNPENKDEPPFSELDQGKTGVFCISRGGSSSICTIPVTINSPIFDQGTHIRLEVTDHFGTPFIIEITSGAKSITKSKHQHNVYLLPSDARFLDIGRNVARLQDSTKDYIDRDKALKIAKAKDVVIVTSDDGNVFNLAGTNLKEVANDARGVGRTKAKWHLVTLGSTPSEADHILDRAQESGTAKLIGTKPLITQAEKRAEVFREKVLPLLEKMPNMKVDLIKEASVIEDEQVVDKVLALNFLTPENIMTFTEYLPGLEDAACKLAQLLIAIRIGLKRIPEPAAKNAMQGLEVVIAGLRSMEALNNVGTLEGSVQ
jgi:hypothetical protein